MEIKLEKVNEKIYNVITSTDLNIGTFKLDVDGYYHFWNTDCIKGSWSSYSLRLIADKLEELNKPYKESIDNYLEKELIDFEDKLRNITNNFTTGFILSTLMVGDNYQSGYIELDNFIYSIVRYKNKVRVWDKPKDYMAWINGDKDYILEIDVLKPCN